jgi:hypothetical protein
LAALIAMDIIASAFGTGQSNSWTTSAKGKLPGMIATVAFKSPHGILLPNPQYLIDYAMTT